MNLLGCRRERQHDVFDPLVPNDAFEIPALGKDRETRHVASVERLLVEERDRRQPDLGMLAKSLRHQSPDVSSADDQRALTGLAPSSRTALGGEKRDPAR